MKQQSSNLPKSELIEVDVNELQFIRKNAPKAFARTVSEALTAEGYPIHRVAVHNELRTLKDGYDSKVIAKTRELLKAISKIEFISE